MPPEFCEENETEDKYALQSIVISMAGFFLSGGDMEEIGSASLAALKEAVEAELVTRQGTIH